MHANNSGPHKICAELTWNILHHLKKWPVLTTLAASITMKSTIIKSKTYDTSEISSNTVVGTQKKIF